MYALHTQNTPYRQTILRGKKDKTVNNRGLNEFIVCLVIKRKLN